MKTETNTHIQITFFRFTTSRFWAFKQMLLGPRSLQSQPGLQFFKFLGTGGGKGFSLWPDFGTYAILTVWDTPNDFTAMVKTNTYWATYMSKASEYRRLDLIPVHSHGLWSGVNPFAAYQEKSASRSNQNVAVVTRATLRWNRLLSFWRSVPKAAKTIEGASGVVFYKGVGEWPWIQQATVSIWHDFEAVHDFAYKNRGHADIVRKTKAFKWYKEDLFSRFVIDYDTKFQSTISE